MEKKKQLSINIIAQTIAFVVNFGINFFLTPYILSHVGREAYGFVALGNNFINYASLLSIALNSMAGRFVTVKIHQDDFKSANEYYASVVITDVVLAALLSVPSILIVLNLGRIVRVPMAAFADIQALWALLFLTFLLDVITATFATALFAANRLDIQSKRNIVAYLLKAGICVSLYALFPAKVWYIGFANLVCTLFAAVANLISGRKLYPKLKVKRENYNLSKVKELISSGIWNSISRVGSIALTELDLLLSNLFISSQAMGTLSIAKTVPSYVSSFISSVISVFLPGLTISYAKGNTEQITHEVKSYIRLLIFFQTIIYGGLIAYLNQFFKLWLPKNTTDIRFIYILSILTIADCVVSPIASIMFNIFTVTNRIRFSSIVVTCTGLVSIVVTFCLVKTTSLGLIAVAGVSVLLCNIRNIGILIPYGAKCLDQPWYTFYGEVLLNILSLAVSITICTLVKNVLFRSDTWFCFLISAGVSALAVAVANFYIVLKKEERSFILNKVYGKAKSLIGG